MKITVEMNDLLEHALDLHLNQGIPMQAYFRAAVHFFKDAYKQEQTGKKVGFGDASRFSTYNTEMSPKNYLDNRKDE